MASHRLISARYSEDRDLLQALRSHPALGSGLASPASGSAGRNTREQLLASAVRVDARVLPRLAESIERVRRVAGLEEGFEVFVYEDASINAFVTRGRSRLLLGLSSGAVNLLGAPELEFVIGHELGHALFDHVDQGARALLERDGMAPRDRMQILAWSRASEISADRVGLLCCSSLDVAARALFQSLSGLGLRNVEVDPVAFAAQWDVLAREVIETGGQDHWQLSHPFAPLRMKAMLLFHDSPCFAAYGDPNAGDPGASLAAVDAEIGRLLAVMDPLAREDRRGGDPLVSDLVLFGSLAVALEDGPIDAAVANRLAELTSAASVEAARDAVHSREAALEQFAAALASRSQRLRATEIHRVLHGVLHAVASDRARAGKPSEMFERIAGLIGVGPDACALLVSRTLDKRSPS